MGISITVETCCCGTNLRTGTMIIGTLDLIGALSTIILASIGAYNAQFYYYYNSSGGYWETDPMGELRPMYITMAVLSSFLLVFDILLLCGASQRKHKLILPWILYACISLLSNFICALIYGIYSITYYYYSDAWGYTAISWGIFYLAIKIYFLLVVWSLYQQMKGANPGNGGQATIYPTVPIGQQPYPNGPQTYPNGQMQYPNGQMQYPNVQMQYPNQPQPYPNVQQPYPQVPQFYPNAQVQQPYPNPQQPFPNPQQPYPIPQQPFPNPQPLPSMDEMKRDV